MPSSILKKIKEKILKYNSDEKHEKMRLFIKKAKEDLNNHFKNTEYVEHEGLMKEINYLLHYSFLVLNDDFNKGEKVFLRGITNLDDYIFSSYKGDEKLKENIKKLNIVSFSNRFEETPKENFLSYFVFIEEMGFELIEILQEYYDILSGIKRVKIKSQKEEKIIDQSERDKTILLLTEKITRVMVSNKVQQFILNENLEER